MTTMTPKEIVDYAIQREIEAASFYRRVADMQKKEHVKEMFLDYAKEEDRHKELLESLDFSNIETMEVKKIPNLKISDHLVEIEPHTDMDYKEALILGMQKEKKAYQLYMGLAASTDNPEIKKLFSRLAQEEASHKLYFETLYDDFILQEN